MFFGFWKKGMQHADTLHCTFLPFAAIPSDYFGKVAMLMKQIDRSLQLMVGHQEVLDVLVGQQPSGSKARPSH